VFADTSREAELVQRAVQRRLGPEQRFRTACQMSVALREMAITRIRAQFPELDDRGVLDKLLRELYGFRRDTK
jgi:hypothetical protein